MRLSFLSTLDAVLRTGSLAGAAAEMNLTPSAISMQMRQLEAYFGQPLFDRSGLQVRPTPFALEAGAVVRQTLGQVERLRRHTPIAVEGTVRLGVIETMQPALLPGLIGTLRQRHPALVVRPVRGRSVELLAALKAGDIDAAVLVQPASGGAQRLAWCGLMRRELVLVAPPDAAPARFATLFKRHAWIRFDPLTHTGRLASRYVRAHAAPHPVSVDLQSVSAIVAMVSAGLGVSVVPEPDPRLCVAYPVRVLRLGAQAPALQISFVSRKPDAGRRTLVAVLEAAREIVKMPVPGLQRLVNPELSQFAMIPERD